MNINLNEGYDLLDDFFIDQDSTTNTGEVQSSGVDANILVNNKDVSKQINLMRTAVDKIYKGYLAAYDKASYKEQFDLYPMRDFDEHMAGLGARRSINGLDFEPVGTKVDWVQKIKDEISARLSAREKQDLENKKDEKTETTQTTTKPKTDYNTAINTMLESVPSNGILGGLDVTQTTMLKRLDPASRKTIIDGLMSSTDNSENNKFIKTRLVLTDEQLSNLRKQIKDIVTTADLTNEKETKAEVKAKNDTQASETTPGDSTQSTRDIEANKAKYESIRKKIKDLESDLSKLPDIMVGEKTNINSQLNSLKSELSDVEKQNKILSDKLKTATKLRSKNIKGAKVNAEDLDKLNKSIQTDYERKISEYDGFTTAGPFCLEKRKYFRDIYRPSIDHFDTEFRESIPTPIAKISDIGNDIISIMHKKGTMPTTINTAEDFAKLPPETQKQFKDTSNKLKTDLETFTKNMGVPPVSKTFEDFCVVTKYILSVIVKKADAWLGYHDKGVPIFDDVYFTKIYNLLIDSYSKLFTNNEDDIKILTESYWDPDMEIIRNKFFLYMFEIVQYSLTKHNTEFGSVLSQSYLTEWQQYKNAKNIGEAH